MEGTGIVPVMDMNRGYGYGDGFGYGGGWFMWIIVLFALMGGWGNGWNRGNGAGLTQVEMQQGLIHNPFCVNLTVFRMVCVMASML